MFVLQPNYILPLISNGTVYLSIRKDDQPYLTIVSSDPSNGKSRYERDRQRLEEIVMLLNMQEKRNAS